MSKKSINILIIILSAIITLSVILAICYQTRVGEFYGQGTILPGSILSAMNADGTMHYTAIDPDGLYYERLYFIELPQIYWLVGITTFNSLLTTILLVVLNKKN